MHKFLHLAFFFCCTSSCLLCYSPVILKAMLPAAESAPGSVAQTTLTAPLARSPF